MTTRRCLPILLACLSLTTGGLAAGCGSDEDDATVARTTPKPQPAAEGAAADPVQVTAKDIKFLPPTVTAKVGQKIEWVNEDSIPHTVSAETGAEFDSGNLDQGDTFAYTPRKAGDIKYLCEIHPNQQGTITVTE